MRLKRMSAAMARESTSGLSERFWHCWALCFSVWVRARSHGAEVSGVVRMPEICSPAVSPAVVYLTAVAPKGDRRDFSIAG